MSYSNLVLMLVLSFQIVLFLGFGKPCSFLLNNGHVVLSNKN